MKPTFGDANVYGHAYTYVHGQSDTVGNPPPYQVSSAIFSTSVHARQLVPSRLPKSANARPLWRELGAGKFADRQFPERAYDGEHHRRADLRDPGAGILSAAALGAADFAYALNVNGVHYPLDVIGGRILGTYLVAETLAGEPTYAGTTFTPGQSASAQPGDAGLFRRRRQFAVRGAMRRRRRDMHRQRRHPDRRSVQPDGPELHQFSDLRLPSVAPTDLDPVVPADAHVLIATRFPYLSPAQLNDILASTELPSGGPIDDGSGWARLNLYAASGGYGAFAGEVVVTMNAARGGLYAFDVWSNNISNTISNGITEVGSLTLQGDRHAHSRWRRHLHWRNQSARRHVGGHRLVDRRRISFLRRHFRRQRRRRFIGISSRLHLSGGDRPGRRQRDSCRRYGDGVRRRRALHRERRPQTDIG